MYPVTLTIPLISEYVIIARLAASGFCARLGFDLDMTEDVKVTISEVLNKCIVKKENDDDEITLIFEKEDDIFEITFYLEGITEKMQPENELDLGISIINALCSELFFSDEDQLVIRFRLGDFS